MENLEEKGSNEVICEGREKGGKGRKKGKRKRAEAFKRLLVTKPMGSFIPCFCRSFIHFHYTVRPFGLVSVLNGGGRRESEAERRKYLFLV